MKRRGRFPVILAVVIAALCTAVVVATRYVRGPVVHYTPRDTTLRSLPLYFYPAEGADSAHPRAFVFFLGNDVAFWKPHEELAARLASRGYAVVGLDHRRFLGALPSGIAERDSAYRADIVPLMAHVRHEMHADSAPMILAGHSSGAETALWIAANVPPPGLRGVLAMSPRGSGHLRVTAADLANAEPSGPGSYSTIDLAAAVPSGVRIALIRGAHDSFARHDSAFAAAAAGRIRVIGIPFAGHSLEKLLLVAPAVESAVDWLLEPR